MVGTLPAQRRSRRAGIGDAGYLEKLATLSEGSVRRSFNPYVDIEWDSPELAVSDDDPRWVLPETELIGHHPWYREQPVERQIAMGMWHHANTAKVALHFENILIRGLMNFTFRLPNGSPEHRYCLHEMIEEGNHNLMFQEMVERIGIDVPGMPRYLRWISPFVPLYGALMPNVFFLGVLAGEDPFDHVHRNILRHRGAIHPIVERTAAIHVAEEARHISFGHEHLRRSLPRLWRWQRFLLSLYVPLVMLALGRAAMVPPRAFWRRFGVPRKVRKQMLFRSPHARRFRAEMFADVRMLCYEAGLMNPVARLLHRLFRFDGAPSRYRGEPKRRHPAA